MTTPPTTHPTFAAPTLCAIIASPTLGSPLCPAWPPQPRDEVASGGRWGGWTQTNSSATSNASSNDSAESSTIRNSSATISAHLSRAHVADAADAPLHVVLYHPHSAQWYAAAKPGKWLVLWLEGYMLVCVIFVQCLMN